MRYAFGALLLLAAAAHADDPCTKIDDCPDCIATVGCGWCSTPVLYEDGRVGTRCAGPKFGNPFTCTGIYSTDKCVQGYLCNQETQQCEMAAPGQGLPKEQCQKQCKPGPAPVYACDAESKKCYIADPGTPGSASKAVCEESCGKDPTPTPPTPPSPPSPPKPPVTPTPPTPPAPGPSPPVINSVWRGIFVQAGFAAGEVGVELTNSSATIVLNKQLWAQGAVGNKGPSQMFLTIDSGAAGKKGDVIPLNFVLIGQGPETGFAEVAVGELNAADVPASAAAVMDGKNGHAVMELVKCFPGDKDCSFVIQTPEDAAAYARKVSTLAAVNDPCSPAPTCEECLALNPQCGWCSQAVNYVSGQKGAQCAGVNSGITPFVCEGVYSTEQCFQGYECNTASGECEMAAPGQGIPLEQCQKTCAKATPAPTTPPTPPTPPKPVTPTPPATPAPEVPKFHCNFTSLQCEEGGELSQDECDGLCVKPKPGPPSVLLGKWRGVQINAQYVAGEFDLEIDETTATLTRDGEAVWKAEIFHFENVYLRFHILTGKHADMYVDAFYQIAAIGSQEVAGATLVLGAYGGGMPKDFKSGMHQPNSEFVLYKCKDAAALCQF